MNDFASSATVERTWNAIQLADFWILLEQAGQNVVAARPMFWSFASDPSRRRGGLRPNNQWLSMLRRLALDDMDLAPRLHRFAFDHALPTLAGLHTPEEDRWFYRERMFQTCQLWGAFDASGLLGVIAVRDGWIDQLYAAVGARARCREQAARRCAT